MFDKLDEKLDRYESLERQMADPEVLADGQRYNDIAREYGKLAPTALRYRTFRQLKGQLADAQTLTADADMAEMAAEEVQSLTPQVQAAKDELIDLVLAGSAAEHKSLIVEIRAGAGGDEASLFARDLHEMYTRYAEARGWKVEALDHNATEVGGFKEISFSIAGDSAFLDLQFESGGHRVQRVPETETQGRIHTSAATVAVLPELDEVDVDIDEGKIAMETFMSGGPGGQHQNKTASGVRLRYTPEGFAEEVVVECRSERSQHKNRATAMRMLRSRIYDRLQQQADRERAEERRSLIGSGDRSERIRTYNFPQNRCTDHRIGQNFSLEQVVGGDLGKLVAALHAYDRDQRLGELAGAL